MIWFIFELVVAELQQLNTLFVVAFSIVNILIFFLNFEVTDNLQHFSNEGIVRVLHIFQPAFRTT